MAFASSVRKILKTRCLSIYTDGSCSNNGKPGARAGWSFAIPLVSLLAGGPVPSDQKQTNNTGELTAIYEGLRYVCYLSSQHSFQQVRVVSDSEYCIKGLTIWKKNYYPGSTRANNDTFVKILGLIESLSRSQISVIYKHINSHLSTSDKLLLSPEDQEDVFYNEQVDAMAGRFSV